MNIEAAEIAAKSQLAQGPNRGDKLSPDQAFVSMVKGSPATATAMALQSIIEEMLYPKLRLSRGSGLLEY
jgi:NADH:ubiquinone oxidoreductase subunit B-like Fe-S oxidoreductase